MSPKDPLEFIDHINSNPLDNRRINLRYSDAKKNAQNKSKKEGATSNYFGVSYDSFSNKWIWEVTKDGDRQKKYEIDEELAAILRDLYILTHYRDQHYKLNFEWDAQAEQEWTEWNSNRTF
jgi:hypothetical protein